MRLEMRLNWTRKYLTQALSMPQISSDCWRFFSSAHCLVTSWANYVSVKGSVLVKERHKGKRTRGKNRNVRKKRKQTRQKIKDKAWKRRKIKATENIRLFFLEKGQLKVLNFQSRKIMLHHRIIYHAKRK